MSKIISAPPHRDPQAMNINPSKMAGRVQRLWMRIQRRDATDEEQRAHSQRCLDRRERRSYGISGRQWRIYKKEQPDKAHRRRALWMKNLMMGRPAAYMAGRQ